MEFHDKIINARRQKGLTQEAMAESIGVSRQAVSKWETGESKPDVDKLIALCQTLELTMDYLCLGADSPSPEEAQPQPLPPVQQKKSLPLKWQILSMVLVFLLGVILGCICGYQLHIETPSLEQVSIAGTWLELSEDGSGRLQCRIMLNDAWQTVGVQILTEDPDGHKLYIWDGTLHSDGTYHISIDDLDFSGKLVTLYVRLYTEQEEQVLELADLYVYQNSKGCSYTWLWGP